MFIGLGYTAYYVFTRLAIVQQANAFLMENDANGGFFPLLQEGDPVQVNAAFLLALPESARGHINPEDMPQMTRHFDGRGRQGQGQLSAFREHYLVQALGRGGQECKIEPQGVQEWGYEKNGYLVTRVYRITTPEAIIRAFVPVRSSEGESGGMRKWFVDFPKLSIRVDYPPLGQALKGLSEMARTYLDSLLNDLRLGKNTEAIPDKTDWARVTKGKEIRDYIKDILKGGKENYVYQPAQEKYLNPWRLENGKPHFDFFGRLQFPGAKNTPITADCKITVACQEVVVPPGQEQPDPASFPLQPHWRIAAFEVVRIMSMGPPPR